MPDCLSLCFKYVHQQSSDSVRMLCGVVVMIQVADNQVMMVRTKEKHGYSALQVAGLNQPKIRNVDFQVLCTILFLFPICRYPGLQWVSLERLVFLLKEEYVSSE